jgi:xanthine dehydrogenase molybdopterin-binding subunit B
MLHLPSCVYPYVLSMSCVWLPAPAPNRFGGKASRSMPVAAAAALAATLLQRPVAYSLTRNEDFAVNGGRCAGLVEYEVGYGPDGKLVAVDAKVCVLCG